MHVVKTTVGLSDTHIKELSSLVQKKSELEKKIKRLESLQTAQQKHRDKKKKMLSQLKVSHPEAAERLKTPGKAGRPPLQSRDDPAGLHNVILNLVCPESSVDDRGICLSR